MRIATLALVVFGACGGGGDHPAKPAGKHVRLEDQPVAEWIGLPMSGDAVVTMDVQGQEDLTTAKGRVEITCPTGCRLGDDKTKLPDKSGFSDGITVPHIDLDRVDIVLAIGGGKATIERFEVTSQDLVVRVTGAAKLDKPFDRTQLDLCIRFGATPALQQRDPTAFALLQTTGAAKGAGDANYIAVTGTVGDTRMMARVCDGSAPAPAPSMPTAPKLAAPQLPTPAVP